MKIAVDLDGVVYEWQRTYRYMMREYHGVEMPRVEEFWHSWDAQKQYGEKAMHDWMWSRGIEEGLFRYGHMVAGARIGLQTLAAEGHKIEIATHRPVNAVSDTIDWVSLYFKGIPLYGLHILSGGETKTIVQCDLLVDDKPENVSEWLTTGRNAILYDQPWNREYQLRLMEEPQKAYPMVARSWKDVVEWVRKTS